MIPLKDLTPRRSFPTVTLLLIIVNVIVFSYQVSLPEHAAERFVMRYAVVPAKIQMALAGSHYTLTQALIPLFTCMFLHAGWLHIIGNMWFLWIFGGNVEDRMGPVAYLLFYLTCGVGSSIAQTAFSWGSHVPALGASGAIAGVLGAYIIYFPGSQILTLVILFIFWFRAQIPAVVFIGLWFLVQFLSGVGALGASGANASGGVAWWAHVGGFVLGMLLAKIISPNARSAAYL
ncbi:MAG: rhomboid family intramembrane serine protease [Candidatus Acidiferrales bacterium]